MDIIDGIIEAERQFGADADLSEVDIPADIAADMQEGNSHGEG